MTEAAMVLSIALLFLFLGISIGQGRRNKKIKNLELANRILREALDSERRKVDALNNLRHERRNFHEAIG